MTTNNFPRSGPRMGSVTRTLHHIEAIVRGEDATAVFPAVGR